METCKQIEDIVPQISNELVANEVTSITSKSVCKQAGQYCTTDYAKEDLCSKCKPCTRRGKKPQKTQAEAECSKIYASKKMT